MQFDQLGIVVGGQEVGQSEGVLRPLPLALATRTGRDFGACASTLPDSPIKVPGLPYPSGGLDKAWKILRNQLWLAPVGEVFFDLTGPPELGVPRRPVIRSMRMR